MELDKEQEGPSYYNRVFAQQKPDYSRLFYYKWAVNKVIQLKLQDKKGLDIGCGQGGFLELAENRNLKVEGLDFSIDGLNQAAGRTKTKLWFSPFNTFEEWHFYDYFVILETLEHIKDDMGLLKLLPKDSFVIAAVPGYNSAAHVRCFPKGVSEVMGRYSRLFSEYQCENVGKAIYGFSGRVK